MTAMFLQLPLFFPRNFPAVGHFFFPCAISCRRAWSRLLSRFDSLCCCAQDESYCTSGWTAGLAPRHRWVLVCCAHIGCRVARIFFGGIWYRNQLLELGARLLFEEGRTRVPLVQPPPPSYHVNPWLHLPPWVGFLKWGIWFFWVCSVLQGVGSFSLRQLGKQKRHFRHFFWARSDSFQFFFKCFHFGIFETAHHFLPWPSWCQFRGDS